MSLTIRPVQESLQEPSQHSLEEPREVSLRNFSPQTSLQENLSWRTLSQASAKESFLHNSQKFLLYTTR